MSFCDFPSHRGARGSHEPLCFPCSNCISAISGKEGLRSSRARTPGGPKKFQEIAFGLCISTPFAIPWGSSEFQKITKSNTFACVRVCKIVISCPTGAPGDRTKPKEFVVQIAFPRFPGTSVCVPREGKLRFSGKTRGIAFGLCIFLPNEIS